MIKIRVKPDIVNAAYRPLFYDFTKRINVLYGSAGSGKSVAVAQLLIFKALKYRRKILCIRKYASTLRNSVWDLLIDTLKVFKIYDMCRINSSSFNIRLPNGSVILLKGLDDEEKIKSITGITDIWIEEATEITADDFDQLNLRLRTQENYSQIFLTYNPVSKTNWVYKRFHDVSELSENTVVLKTTYKDNAFLPDEYVKTLLSYKETNPYKYKVYVLGEFASLDKLVYNNWEVKDFNPKEIKGDLLIGLDFGFINDPTALIAATLENNTLYVFHEDYKTGLVNSEIAELIKYNGFLKSAIIADSAEQKSIEEIRRLGVRRIKACTKGQGSVLQGISKLQELKIIVHPSCINTITELQNYSWEKDRNTGEYLNKPTDKYNHCLDALRYSLQCLDKNTITTVSKAALGLR